jgi:hypothetical protein
LNMCQAAMVPALQAPAMPARGIARGAEIEMSGICIIQRSFFS